MTETSRLGEFVGALVSIGVLAVLGLALYVAHRKRERA